MIQAVAHPGSEATLIKKCGYCGAMETRTLRSSHIVDEVLAEKRNTIVDAELFAEIDADYDLGVIDGDMDIAEQMVSGFIEYGWAEVDEDGDVVRTRRCKCDWTSQEQRDAEDRGELPRAWKLGRKWDHGHLTSCSKSPTVKGD